jgi:hypothetical protein
MDPFTNLTLLTWYRRLSEASDTYLENDDYAELPAEVTVVGDGPISEREITTFLEGNSIKCMLPWRETEIVVAGTHNWRESDLYEILRHRKGQGLRIYSQEMFLLFLTTHLDPFEHADRAVLEEFTRHHGVFKYLKDQSFDWPSTLVWGEGHKPIDALFLETGMLGYLGYHVGHHGLDSRSRRKILARVFEKRLPRPSSFPKHYLDEWAQPKSCERLQKLAESIAAFCRNAKRRSSPPRAAISDWEADLAWLKIEYYDPCRFRWPDGMRPW